ncbi:Mth938-like domain-containing protein [Rhodovulum tesquicola]|uniref:Mth938-like domain-containing protein n=1 Tax=Rhodovulum tesquicola TaxID=540254 RepID=UPI002097416B|nr:Mth938-like domain-containing protein [Rhodovulum tesquicola]MCO8145371.1 Mth938-like domain-containing protein [Rhodovulum tesquicola]
MRLTEIQPPVGLPVDGYGPGFFRIAGSVHEGPVIVAEGRALAWAGLDDPAPLFALATRVDVLLVGTGNSLLPLPGGLQSRLEAAGLGVEFMASPSAARGYNLLLAEGRRVAAALVPVSAAPPA